MNILVVGNQSNLEECRRKFGIDHSYVLNATLMPPGQADQRPDLMFDFSSSPVVANVKNYAGVSVPIFLNTCSASLANIMTSQAVPNPVFGFAGMPSFLDRKVLEVSLIDQNMRPVLGKICDQLKTEFEIVTDGVGLVTPRVICMIINEAYLVVEEGTATREDVDIAMKLGTNYPYGPFEWCGKIGVKAVVELLLNIREQSGNERYKICRLLEEEYQGLKQE